MPFYEVKQKLRDNLNGFDLLRGEILETEEVVWVARFGRSLELILSVPDGTKAIPIANTIEQRELDKQEVQSFAKETKVKEKVEKPKQESRATLRPIVDKIVRSGDSDVK